MMFNVAPWQFAQSGGFGSPPGQYGQGTQLNGALAQLGLPPLVAACLAAQGAFASVLEQYGQQTIGGWPGHQQPGAQFLSGQGVGYGQQGIGGLLGQHGYQGISGGGISGWPGQPQFLGGPQGAFGQRGPASGFGSYLPFQVAPQVTYAG
jgi:hypothetical protein